jgi:hypothetical protein
MFVTFYTFFIPMSFLVYESFLTLQNSTKFIFLVHSSRLIFSLLPNVTPSRQQKDCVKKISLDQIWRYRLKHILAPVQILYEAYNIEVQNFILELYCPKGCNHKNNHNDPGQRFALQHVGN